VNANQIVLRVIQALEQLHIDYMLVGSFSSNAFGIPRSTQDADFVLNIKNQALTPLVDLLGPDIVFDSQMQLETVTMTSRYIARHAATEFAIELFMLSDDPFDLERFARRQRQSFLGLTVMLPTPEDIIIQKLRWYDRSKRPRDLEDAGNVVAVQKEKLDLDYIRRWTDQHSTRAHFEQLLKDADSTPY
jgi:hypothetical protein